MNTVSVLRALMGKVDNMQELMNNGSREMEILRKNEKEMLEIKKKKKITKRETPLMEEKQTVEERNLELEDPSFSSGQ